MRLAGLELAGGLAEQTIAMSRFMR